MDDNLNFNAQIINGSIYRSKKCQLTSIIRDEKHIAILFDATLKTHNIVIHTYQFLRLWILYKYKNNVDIPIITEDIIGLAFSALTERGNQGKKPTGDKLKLLNELKNFYENEYKKLNYEKKINSNLLGQILSDMATDILTNIENNIKLNFFGYVKRFVNSSFKKQHNDILDNCQKGEKIKIRKQLNKDLYDIKEDLFNCTLKSDNKYHDWINNNRKHILPSEYKNSYEFDIDNNPQRYLKHMIYMCLEIEKIGTKSFQFFPLRTNLIPKYIPIDTVTLINLFIKKPKKAKKLGKKENIKDEILVQLPAIEPAIEPANQLPKTETKRDLLMHVGDNEYPMWNRFFKLDENKKSKNYNIFKGEKNYSFDYKITTDCFSASVQLIRTDQIEVNKQKNQNIKNARNATVIRRTGMSEQEKDADRDKIS